MSERPKELASKASVVQATVGSNPTVTASCTTRTPGVLAGGFCFAGVFVRTAFTGTLTVKHGASINSTLCRPCACAMTPQAGQPITSGRTDSTSTRSPASSRWTPTT